MATGSFNAQVHVAMPLQDMLCLKVMAQCVGSFEQRVAHVCVSIFVLFVCDSETERNERGTKRINAYIYILKKTKLNYPPYDFED
jgi:hypothetical protein